MNLSLTPEEQQAVLLLMGTGGTAGNNPLSYDEASLKKAYRCKVKKSHPDLAISLGKDPVLMKNQFQELNDAFCLLLERIRRDNSEFTKQSYRRARPGAYKPTSQSTRKQWDKTWDSRKNTKTGKTYKTSYTYHAKRRPSYAGSGMYYTGLLPGRVLRFAEYLYYSGEITWEDLVQALVWQYRNRPKLGELAESAGLLNREDILHVIKNRNIAERFGDAAVRLGIMNRRAVDNLVRRQKMFGQPIGKFFLEKRVFTEDQLSRKLRANRRHNIMHSS